MDFRLFVEYLYKTPKLQEMHYCYKATKPKVKTNISTHRHTHTHTPYPPNTCCFRLSDKRDETVSYRGMMMGSHFSFTVKGCDAFAQFLDTTSVAET